MNTPRIGLALSSGRQLALLPERLPVPEFPHEASVASRHAHMTENIFIATVWMVCPYLTKVVNIGR